MERYKPKKYYHYYVIQPDGSLNVAVWYENFADLALYRLGNCYHSPTQAKADADKWIAFYASEDLLEVQ